MGVSLCKSGASQRQVPVSAHVHWKPTQICRAESVASWGGKMWMVASWNKNKKSWNLILEAGREAQGEEGSCREIDQEARDVVLTNFERREGGIQPPAENATFCCFLFKRAPQVSLAYTAFSSQHL